MLATRKFVFASLFLLASICFNLKRQDKNQSSLFNFQERILYLSEEDNVCSFGQESDMLQIQFTFDDDQEKRLEYVMGNTVCWEESKLNSEAIQPQDWTQYHFCKEELFEDCDYVIFDQEKKVQKIDAKIVSISSRIKIKELAKFNGKDYSCAIQGDGKVHHFGPTPQNSLMPMVKVDCRRSALILASQ